MPNDTRCVKSTHCCHSPATVPPTMIAKNAETSSRIRPEYLAAEVW